MGMGLCNDPATCQRAMELVLRGLTWTQFLVYLDDVIVLGKDFADGLANVRTTLQRFREYPLKIKPKKCDLFRLETEFLGKVVSSSGISIAPSKKEAVKAEPRPMNQNEVLAFLGFLNYHRDHLKDFASLSACFNDLAYTKGNFKWEDTHEEAFLRAKTALVTVQCLSYPRPNGLFVWTLMPSAQYFHRSKAERKR